MKIIVIGAGLAAETLGAYLASDPRYDLVAFAVEKQFITVQSLLGLPVVAIETMHEQFNCRDYNAVMAVGYSELNDLRAKLFNQVRGIGYEVETYIHPDAKVYSDNIGEGTVVMPNSVVEANATVGLNVVVWANCVVGHHSIIEDHAWLASGTVVGGASKVGAYSFLGINTTIANDITIAKKNLIGANTGIFKHTQPDQVYLSPQGENLRYTATEYARFALK